MASPVDAHLPPPPGILDQGEELHRQKVPPDNGVERDRNLEEGQLLGRLFPPGPLFTGAGLNMPVGDGSVASDRSGHIAGSDRPDDTRGSRGRAAWSTGPLVERGAVAARS